MKYIIETPRFGGHIIITYADNGILCAFEQHTDISNTAQLMELMSKVPITERSARHLLTNSKVKITQVPTDLSFEAFWNKYDHKVSSKKKCEKIWNAMSEADRLLAMIKLTRYNLWQSQQPTAKPYAETWLHQRRFENEY
jgi:hypothetical protein